MNGSEKQIKWASEILLGWSDSATNETAKRGLDNIKAHGKAGDVIDARELAGAQVTEALMFAARVADKFGPENASHGALNRHSQLRYDGEVLGLVEAELKEIQKAQRAARRSR